MKPLVFTSIVLASILFSGSVLADGDCSDPVAEWQPREMLRQRLEQQGWKVQRIKVDDGCYEVRGVDGHGNKFKGKYSPKSLRVKELEIKYSQDGDAATYLEPGQKRK